MGIAFKIWLNDRYYRLKTIYNALFNVKTLLKRRKLHLGCGDVYLPESINIDYRPTRATDLAADCTDLSFLPKNWFAVVYSNAFLEHVYKQKRVTTLRSINRTLNQKGYVFFTGIPDFLSIAKAYINKLPGITEPRFTVDQAYRYTHGDPEGNPSWWLGQLHKSLFDPASTARLLQEAGFRSICIFTYLFRNEKTRVALGFIAWKYKGRKISKEELKQICSLYPSNIEISSIQIEWQTKK